MNLRELVERGQLLQVRCGDCNARIPVDPNKAEVVYGQDSEVSALSGQVTCPSCGSAETTLSAWTPVVTPAEQVSAA